MGTTFAAPHLTPDGTGQQDVQGRDLFPPFDLVALFDPLREAIKRGPSSANVPTT
jgi:hypothetical protein